MRNASFFITAIALAIGVTPRLQGAVIGESAAMPSYEGVLDNYPYADRLKVARTGSSLALRCAVVGSGIKLVGSPVYRGSYYGAGVFTGGYAAGLDVNQGVILTTGRTIAAMMPNYSSSTSNVMFRPGDSDLTEMAGVPTYDASSLSFNFATATGDVYFRYAFASEEYNEKVGVREDPMAIWIDGENLAMAPNTTTRVSSNSVNLGMNSDYYNNNQYPGSNYSLTYDGFTKSFLVHVTGLNPAKTHNIKMAIADGEGMTHDSALFVSGLSSVMAAKAGNAGHHNLHTSFGPLVYASVPGRGSYAGVGSKVMGPASVGAQYLGTGAVILAGDNNSARRTIVRMNWRSRSDVEEAAEDEYPILPEWAPYLASDVVNLRGTNRGEPYVLQMDYSEQIVDAQDELHDAPIGHLFLGSLSSDPRNPTGWSWVNAVDENVFAPGAFAMSLYQGSWLDFISPGEPGWGKSLDDLRGSWGVDIDSNTTWAVLDYSNAQFSVVPEPATIVLLAALAICLCGWGSVRSLRSRSHRS